MIIIDIHLFILHHSSFYHHLHGIGSLQGQSNQLIASHTQQFLHNTHLLEVTLVCHITSRAVRADVHLSIAHLERAVLCSGQYEAIGLTVHGFRAQGGSHQEYLLALQRGELSLQLEHFDLNAGVSLGNHTLSRSAVVISTDLAVQRGVNGRTLAELHATSLLQLEELPADEAVVVGVHAGGDERTAEVGTQTELLEVLHAERGEESQPVLGILRVTSLTYYSLNGDWLIHITTAKTQTYHKLGNLFSGNSLFLQNSPLMNGTAAGLGNKLRLLAVELSRDGLLHNFNRLILRLFLSFLL